MPHTVSSKTLIKATCAALVIAIVALIMFILPAEYNIDMTGAGESLGLTTLAQTNEPPSADGETLIKSGEISDNEQTIAVVVPSGRGVEYKFFMPQYAKMTYEWQTQGEALYFDLHGEPEGDTSGYFESYAITTAAKMEGSFTTPFAGSHGWYWRNNTDKEITVTLTVAGNYEVIGLKK